MALALDTHAPEFSLPTISADGPALVNLSDYKGKNVVLLFFPMAFTSVCTEELCSLSQGLDAYAKLNASVLAVSGDNPFAQAVWAEKEGIKVTLLSDYEHETAKAYDVAYHSFLPDMNLPMGGVAKRSAFVIDKDGIIQYSESSNDPKQLPDFEAIQAKLAQLS